MISSSRAVLVGLCVVVLVASPVLSHQFILGSTCKEKTPVANFDPERFNGTWYVQKKTATTSSCMGVKFNWQSETESFLIQEKRVPIGSTLVNVDAQITNQGEITMRDTPGVMKLNWEGVGLNWLSYTYTVLDTDYDNYALDFECQNLMFAKRVSATILTRVKNPSAEDLQTWTDAIGTYSDVNLNKLNTISQDNCVDSDEVDFDIAYNDNGVSLMQLAEEAVKKIETEEQAQIYTEEVKQLEEGQSN